MNDWVALLLLGGVVFLGSAMQRVSGMGFALVASPFLVGILGPFQGVLLVNVLGAVTSFALFLTVLKHVEYRRALTLLIPAIIAVAPGAIVARLVPGAILATVIGVLIIIALCVSLFAGDRLHLTGTGGAIVAGGVSGFMSVTAGVGGPAIASYAVATRWAHAGFAATMQLYFGVLATVSLAAKGALPHLTWQQWATCGGALIVGIVAGHVLARLLRPPAARMLVIVIAFAGAVAIIIKGVLELVGS